MTDGDQPAAAEEMLDVRRAAELVRRHPETIRRWVGAGRLAAHRQGNRLLMARGNVEAAAGRRETLMGLAEWATDARALCDAAGTEHSGRSAAALVLDGRARDRHARAGR